MNSREQYLKKQVERKDAQISVLVRAFENLTVENELLGSIACAFAWDLVTEMNRGGGVCNTASDQNWFGRYDPRFCTPNMIAEWDEAVKAVGG